MSGTLRLRGATSGYSELQAPAVAADQTFVLPTAGGTLLTTDSPVPQLTLQLGSVSEPSLRFEGDTDTGLFSQGTNTLNLVTGGSSKVVLGADAHTIFAGTNASVRAIDIDSSGRLGVGTSSPGTILNIRSDSSDDGILLEKTDGTDIARLFHDATTTDARLDMFSGGSANIQLRANGVSHFSGGNVGVGTTSPACILDVNNVGRFLSATPSYPSTGKGVEVYFDSAGDLGYIQAYDRTGATWKGLTLAGDTLQMRTAGNERARIDSSGRLLVGTTIRSGNTSAVFQANSASSTGAGVVQISRGQETDAADTNIGNLEFTDSSGNIFGKINCSSDAAVSAGTDHPGRLVFSTTADGAASPTERMRIRATGVVGTSRGMVIGSLAGGVNDDALIIGSSVIASGAGTYTLKWNSSTGVVTYDTSSRLIKEEIIDCPYGIDEVKQLQPRKYFRIDDQREEIGFIADEVADLMPEFVPVGPKSVITRNDQDTEVIPFGVNYDKLTAVLTKALQEAIGRIETLEAEVAALKAQ